MENNDYLCTGNEENEMNDMNIKQILDNNGSNISDMAEKLGVQQPSLSRSIKNDTITTRQLREMANYCNKSVTEFIGCAVPKELKININGQEYIYQLKK